MRIQEHNNESFPHTSILVNKAKCTEKRGQNNLKNQGRHMVVLPIKQKCQFRNNSNPLFTSTCTSSKQVHKSHPEILLQKINSITRTRLQVYLSSLRVPNPSRYNIFGRFGRQPFQPAAAVRRQVALGGGWAEGFAHPTQLCADLDQLKSVASARAALKRH